MVAGWLITTIWFVAGICATGAFWFFLGAGNRTGTVLSGVGTVASVLLAIGLQIRNERIRDNQQAVQASPVTPPPSPREAPEPIHAALPGAPQRALNADERDLLASISTEGRDLLLAAAHNQHGAIFVSQSLAGLSITVGDHIFCDPGNPRVEARARRSLQELSELGFVEDRGGNGSILSVTDQGFRAADLVERLRKPAV